MAKLHKQKKSNHVKCESATHLVKILNLRPGFKNSGLPIRQQTALSSRIDFYNELKCFNAGAMRTLTILAIWNLIQKSESNLHLPQGFHCSLIGSLAPVVLQQKQNKHSTLRRHVTAIIPLIENVFMRNQAWHDCGRSRSWFQALIQATTSGILSCESQSMSHTQTLIQRTVP